MLQLEKNNSCSQMYGIQTSDSYEIIKLKTIQFKKISAT